MSNQDYPINGKSFVESEQDELIRPAFNSDLSAICFLILVIFALTLPKIISHFDLISPTDSYNTIGENMGEYSFIKEEIFNKTEDIDILFLGGSIIWNAIDTPYVQKALSEKLGRPAKVVTFGFYFSSFDIPYTLVRDLLEKRRVKMIIFSIPRDKIDDGPSIPGCKFIRYDKHGELLKDLPLGYRISSYACGVLRSPRDLVTIIRQNKSKPSPFTENLGADKDALGMYLSPQKFEKFTPPPPVFPSESLFYSSFNQDQFLFLDEKFNAHQDRYLDEMIKLLKAKEVPLVMLNVPQYRESKLNKVIEYHDWSKKFGMETPLIGIPPTVLFNGLSDKEIEKFHYEEDHMNVNGMEYFTKAVLPAILEVYEKRAAKNF